MAPFCPDFPGAILFLQTPPMQTLFKIHKIDLTVSSIEECATPVPSILEECPSPPSSYNIIPTSSPAESPPSSIGLPHNSSPGESPPSYIFRRQDSIHQSPSASCILDEEEPGPGDYSHSGITGKNLAQILRAS